MIRIIYHTDSDGYAAAYAVYRYLEMFHRKMPEVAFWSMGYGSKLPEIDYDNDTVFMVDFSLQPAEKMIEFADRLSGRLWWYDHHDTAVKMEQEHEMLRYVNGERLVELEGKPISGCELAWKFLHGPEHPMPKILEVVGDWDTWRWKAMPEADQHNAKAFQHYFKAYNFDPRTPEGRIRWRNMEYDPVFYETMKEGKTLIKYQENEWKRTAGWLSFEAEFAGYPAILLNRSGNSEMFKGFFNPAKHKFAVAFSYVKGDYLTVSMYADDNNPDIHLGELAERLGTEAGRQGGGHRGAAGFQCSWDYFQTLINR